MVHKWEKNTIFVEANQFDQNEPAPTNALIDYSINRMGYIVSSSSWPTDILW
jgi:hypothetical protein